MKPQLIGRALITALAAIAIAPTEAQAAEFCVVPASGCDIANDPNAHQTFGAALAAADTAGFPGKDTIRLGTATYTPETDTEEFLADANNEVAIVGAGRGKTIFRPGASGEFTLGSFAPNTEMRDLTVILTEGGATRWGVGMLGANSVADNIEILGEDNLLGGSNEAAIIMQQGPITLRNSTIRVPTGPGRDTWGVEFFQPAPGMKVENTTITAEKGVVAFTSGTAAISNSDITAHVGVKAYNGTHNLTVDTTVIRAIPGLDDQPIGLLSSAAGGTQSPVITARSTTLLGNGTGRGVRAEQTNCAGPPTGRPRVVLHNTAVHNFAVAGSATAAGCSPCPAAGSAEIESHFSAFMNGMEILAGGCHTPEAPQFPGSFGFVSDSDPRPRFGSTLIDLGAPGAIGAGEWPTDHAGLNRLVDGNGDGTARRDIGAYEYQRRAPTVTASASPASGPPGTAFTFTATPSDADGDPVTQFVWDFDAMFQATGASANQAFTSLGSHTGTVTVTDASGMKGTGSATVTVASPPEPTPTATPTPTVTPTKPDTSAPVVTIKGGTLKVDKKRKAKVTITCPAAETAPCTIALTASSAKKIALRKGKRKKITSLGKGSGSVPQGKSATVTLTLTKAVFSYLKKKKKLPATLKVKATDAAGNKADASAKATLRAPKK